MLSQRLKYVQFSDHMSFRQLYIVALLLLGSMNVWGQTQNAFIRAAEDAFNSGNYYASLDYYLEAIEFDTADVDLKFRAGDAARHFDSYEKAEELYTYVISEDNEAKYPSAIFQLAFVQQMQGKYDIAKRNYELYISQFENDDQRLTDRANKEISSIDWAKDKILNPEPSITVDPITGDINSPFSEIGAIIDGDKIVYSSVKYFPEDRKKYSDKFIAKVLTKAPSVPAYEIAEEFNKPNLHTANAAFNMNRTRLFYTVCEYTSDSDIRCDLYTRTVSGDAIFGEEVKLPGPINMDSFTTTQPSIGFDKDSGQEVLYFVSNRSGGAGGLDIWAANITGVDSYADPVNISAVNTAYDEVSPFFHKNSQVLYFSSEGDMSIGGLDVYRSLKERGGFQKPENLGAPVNSSYNDVYYTLSEDGDRGLMSSNRYGSQYIDENNKSCCYDVYEVTIGDLEIYLNALTFDAKSLDSLEGVTVQLVSATTGTVINTITNTIGNDHLFQLERGTEYLVISTKRGFYPDTLPVNTNTVYKSDTLIRKVHLERSSLELQVLTFDEISRKELPGTTVTLENLTDGNIQKVVLTNENSNDFVFDVVPGQSYRITASRDRYYEASKEFVAVDNDGSGTILKNLYLTRRDLNIYLPLALYYDNDIPDRSSSSLTTDIAYSETFDEFVIKKLDFKERYARGLSDAEKEMAEARVDTFFENDVKEGYDMFLRFLDYVYGQLQDGSSFDISIRGFASPRADTRYNLALSQRRVESVQNELRTYKNGDLWQFVVDGQLKITELSYGESLAPDNVSDALYDRRNSIYSPEASKERRVEIVEIKQGSVLLNEN